jgi:hypothetical protein
MRLDAKKAPVVLPWPLQRGLEAVTRALLDLGDQSSIDFLRPSGESALLPPDSISWRVFKIPVAFAAIQTARNVRRPSEAQSLPERERPILMDR